MVFDNKTVTPKSTLTIRSMGADGKSEDVSYASVATFKVKRDKVNASIAFSDASLKDVKSMRDVVATVDFKAPKSVTLNSKYELGTKKYTVGGTWDGNVADRAATIKLNYSNKDNLVGGEATLSVAKGQKANITFNQQQMLTAKYTYSFNEYTAEPSYNFVKKSPALAVTRKLNDKDTLKLSYDVKADAAAAEWNRKPFKVVVSTNISNKLAVGRPSVAATFENVYDF